MMLFENILWEFCTMKITQLTGAILLVAGLAAASAPCASAVEIQYELNPAATIRDVLVENVSKRVALRLDAGEEIEGTVAKVGNNLVHIKNLPENELFFILISIDRISAVRLMVRQR